MKSAGENVQKNFKSIKDKTFPIPFPLAQINENISFSTNSAAKLSGEEIINLAYKAHLERKLSEAEKYYQYFIGQGFSDPRAFSNYGILLKSKGKLREAEIFQRKAIELDNEYAEAYSNLGNTLKDLGKLQEAEIAIKKAIKLKPSLYQAYENLAFLLIQIGKEKDAERLIRKAIEINPNLSSLYEFLGSMLISYCKLEEAEIYFRKAIEINPNSSKAYNNLGIIFRDLAKYKEAEILTRKSIKLNPNSPKAYNNLGIIMVRLARLEEAEKFYLKTIEINPNAAYAFFNLYGLSKNINEAEERIKQCLKIDENYFDAKLTLCALKFHQHDKSLFNKLLESDHKDHPYLLSLKWVSTLPNLPELFFNRWSFFDSMIKISKKDRPFYEYGVWRGTSFKYMIDTFKKGFGFDTFEGLPEDWHHEKKGKYSADGVFPKIDGGTFIAGKFEDTLPTFYSEPRPLASIINFDADLYSSTLCALNHSKGVIDEHTVLIFDEFITHKTWEQDEYKALNDFCSINDLTYEVLAISYNTKQVAVKIKDLAKN